MYRIQLMLIALGLLVIVGHVEALLRSHSNVKLVHKLIHKRYLQDEGMVDLSSSVENADKLEEIDQSVESDEDGGSLLKEVAYEKEIRQEKTQSLTSAETSSSSQTIFDSVVAASNGLVNLCVIAFLIMLSITLMLCACLNDPCGCEDILISNMIDRNSLMVVVYDEEGERIGLLSDQQDRSDIYKTADPFMEVVPRDIDQGLDIVV